MTGKLAIGAACALALFTATQRVQAATLSSLIGGPPVTSGGLVFSNFNETGTLPASSINVNFTSNGIQFTANWTTLTPGLDSSIITYAVNTVSGDLSSTTLNMSGSSVVSNAAASVGETVTDNSTGNQYKLQVFDGGNGNPANSFTDTANFNPAVHSINIIKSIDVAASANSSASLDFVENIYTSAGTGQPPPVPEPMSLVLIPVALAGLALRKKLAR